MSYGSDRHMVTLTLPQPKTRNPKPDSLTWCADTRWWRMQCGRAMRLSPRCMPICLLASINLHHTYMRTRARARTHTHTRHACMCVCVFVLTEGWNTLLRQHWGSRSYSGLSSPPCIPFPRRYRAWVTAYRVQGAVPLYVSSFPAGIGYRV